jgi:flagellar basal body-associated protein FliL
MSEQQYPYQQYNPAPTPPSGGMSKNTKIIIIVAVVLVVLVALCLCGVIAISMLSSTRGGGYYGY